MFCFPWFLYFHCLFLFFYFFFFFFNDTATTEIYTLSLHDALPIFRKHPDGPEDPARPDAPGETEDRKEHTSELQSPDHLVCRLLLEKKKKTQNSSELAFT